MRALAGAPDLPPQGGQVSQADADVLLCPPDEPSSDSLEAAGGDEYGGLHGKQPDIYLHLLQVRRAFVSLPAHCAPGQTSVLCGLILCDVCRVR
eukprot:scaffold24748_cov35-Prasinocladus_malaysianus.AAC.2